MTTPQLSNVPPIATFRRNYTVRMADIDGSGFANFSSYVRMMEETEYAFLRERNLSVVLYDERGTLGFPRLTVKVDVNEPLTFDQDVAVELRLSTIDGKTITYDFSIFDSSNTIQDTAAISGQFVVACCRFPDRESPYAILIPEFVNVALTQPIET